MSNKVNSFEIYDTEYAKNYAAYYIHPWRKKHEFNIKTIQNCLNNDYFAKSWLDTCCGQAWHFSQFPDVIKKTGVDRSPAQLVYASFANPEAIFINADVLEVQLPDGSFDLVTNFWGSYCYFSDEQRIKKFLERLIQWTKKGGVIYIELLFPDDVRTFNLSQYSQITGFNVKQDNANPEKWLYYDIGGKHEMLSPPLVFFKELLSPYFNRVIINHDSAFMTHCIAEGKY